MKSANVKGILFIIFSSITAALYKVLFKKAIGNPHIATASIYLTNLGFINLLLLWPIWLILNITSVEKY